MDLRVSTQGGSGDRSSLLHMSTVFPGRVCCPFCGLPQPPEEISEIGACMSCDDELQTGMRVIGMMTEGKLRPANRFNDVIKELKHSAGPATVGVAEAFLEKLGGDKVLGEMMAKDLQLLRKDHIQDPTLRDIATAEADWKAIKGIYELAMRFLAKRDDLVKGEGSNPLEAMEEEDLLAVIAEAAMLRTEVDEDFREKMIEKLIQVDSAMIQEVLAFRLWGVPRVHTPSVKVVEPNDR